MVELMNSKKITLEIYSALLLKKWLCGNVAEILAQMTILLCYAAFVLLFYIIYLSLFSSLQRHHAAMPAWLLLLNYLY
jgi:hypothetical protein